MARTGIDTYLDSIGAVPLLTTEQEIDLGRKVQRMIELQQCGRELTSQEMREVKVGERAMDRFVKANLRLVVCVAKKYVGVLNHMDLMDLVQEGNIGLLTAVRKFDPSRGYKFSTYAFWWIKQSISRGITAKERVIRLPGRVADLASGWNKKVRELSQQLRRMPTLQEIADAFEMPIEEVRTYVNRGQCVVSLDKVAMDGDGSSIMELVVDPLDPEGIEAMERTEHQEMVMALESALGTLTPKEQTFVQRKWGIGSGVEETFVDIGKDHGISRERVRQVVEVAQRKMKFYLTAHQSVQKPAPRPKPVGAFT